MIEDPGHWHDRHLVDRSLGERVADRIAEFGGSWAFIGIFFAVCTAWIIINSIALISARPVDPYPFILLNLGLSLLAAIQAPVILMSQNRAAARDRAQADFDHRALIATKTDIESLQLAIARIESDKIDVAVARIEELITRAATFVCCQRTDPS